MLHSRENLLARLESLGVLTNPAVKDAFEHIDRIDFVSENDESHAYEDHPLSIGHDQTISQPYTVAFMIDLLDPIPGDTILDVGSGSGWTTALLASIVGKNGYVYGVERISELADIGAENVAKYPHLRADIREQSETLGLPEHAPYDKILVSAADTEVPQELIDQLKEGGIMVIPIGDAIWKVIKVSADDYDVERHEGFAFVPLIHG